MKEESLDKLLGSQARIPQHAWEIQHISINGESQFNL